jgi:hypothetical protein
LLDALQFDAAVVVGAVGAAWFIFFARRLARELQRELRVYAVALGITAIAYLPIGLQRGATNGELGLELLGAALYGVAALLGVRRWPMLLAFGWAAHVAWDLFVHHARGMTFAPAWYPPLCVGFDLLVGGYVAGLAIRPRERNT